MHLLTVHKSPGMNIDTIKKYTIMWVFLCFNNHISLYNHFYEKHKSQIQLKLLFAQLILYFWLYHKLLQWNN